MVSETPKERIPNTFPNSNVYGRLRDGPDKHRSRDAREERHGMIEVIIPSIFIG